MSLKTIYVNKRKFKTLTQLSSENFLKYFEQSMSPRPLLLIYYHLIH